MEVPSSGLQSQHLVAELQGELSEGMANELHQAAVRTAAVYLEAQLTSGIQETEADDFGDTMDTDSRQQTPRSEENAEYPEEERDAAPAVVGEVLREAPSATAEEPLSSEGDGKPNFVKSLGCSKCRFNDVGCGACRRRGSWKYTSSQDALTPSPPSTKTQGDVEEAADTVEASAEMPSPGAVGRIPHTLGGLARAMLAKKEKESELVQKAEAEGAEVAPEAEVKGMATAVEGAAEDADALMDSKGSTGGSLSRDAGAGTAGLGSGPGTGGQTSVMSTRLTRSSLRGASSDSPEKSAVAPTEARSPMVDLAQDRSPPAQVTLAPGPFSKVQQAGKDAPTPPSQSVEKDTVKDDKKKMKSGNVNTQIPNKPLPVRTSGIAPGRDPKPPPGACNHCGETESPQWRKGPSDKPHLCNACGTRYLRTGSLQHSGHRRGSAKGSSLSRGSGTSSSKAAAAAAAKASAQVEQAKTQAAEKAAATKDSGGGGRGVNARSVASAAKAAAAESGPPVVASNTRELRPRAPPATTSEVSAEDTTARGGRKRRPNNVQAEASSAEARDTPVKRLRRDREHAHPITPLSIPPCTAFGTPDGSSTPDGVVPNTPLAADILFMLQKGTYATGQGAKNLAAALTPPAGAPPDTPTVAGMLEMLRDGQMWSPPPEGAQVGEVRFQDDEGGRGETGGDTSDVGETAGSPGESNGSPQGARRVGGRRTMRRARRDVSNAADMWASPRLPHNLAGFPELFHAESGTVPYPVNAKLEVVGTGADIRAAANDQEAEGVGCSEPLTSVEAAGPAEGEVKPDGGAPLSGGELPEEPKALNNLAAPVAGQMQLPSMQHLESVALAAANHLAAANGGAMASNPAAAAAAAAAAMCQAMGLSAEAGAAAAAQAMAAFGLPPMEIGQAVQEPVAMTVAKEEPQDQEPVRLLDSQLAAVSMVHGVATVSKEDPARNMNEKEGAEAAATAAPLAHDRAESALPASNEAPAVSSSAAASGGEATTTAADHVAQQQLAPTAVPPAGSQLPAAVSMNVVAPTWGPWPTPASSQEAPEPSDSTQVMKRRRLNKPQRAALIAAFERDPAPGKSARKQLAAEVGISLSQVTSWFHRHTKSLQMKAKGSTLDGGSAPATSSGCKTADDEQDDTLDHEVEDEDDDVASPQPVALTDTTADAADTAAPADAAQASETVAAPQEAPPSDLMESSLQAAKTTSVSPGPAAGLVSTDTMVTSYTAAQWQSAVPSAQASASASAAS